METARLGKEGFEKRKSPSMVVLHMVPGFGSPLYPTLRYSNGSYFIALTHANGTRTATFQVRAE